MYAKNDVSSAIFHLVHFFDAISGAMEPHPMSLALPIGRAADAKSLSSF